MKPRKYLALHKLKLDLRSIPRPSMPHHTCHSSPTSTKSAHEWQVVNILHYLTATIATHSPLTDATTYTCQSRRL